MLHILIDGYNVIRRNDALGGLKPDKDLGRTQFLREVFEHYRTKNCRVTVVFDGTYSDNRTVEEAHHENLQVLFTKFGQTADDLIIELAKREGPGAVVISSDQAILKAVKTAGCGILTSDEFAQRLRFEEGLRRNGLGKDEAEPERRIHTEKKGPRKKKPKAERRALNRLSKI